MGFSVMIASGQFKGLYIACLIFILWITSLIFFLNYSVFYNDPLVYLFILIQTHLYTGVFITMHDCIHGVVVPGSKKANTFIGWFCAVIFAFNSYSRIYRKHQLHHKYSVTEYDPDYKNGGFLVWYGKFLFQYLTVVQFLLMAITFNFLKIYFNEVNLILFWALPSILSTFQLFYFGTYIPHRGTHEPSNIHKARSQTSNHFIAFLTCYFFGYHYEHHAYPWLPWWKLPKARENKQESRIEQDGMIKQDTHDYEG